MTPKPAVGRMLLEVREPAGDLVAARRATNVVLRGGAAIVAERFAGVADRPPIDRMQVGFGRESADVEATELQPHPDGTVEADALVGEVTPDRFTIEAGEDGFVRVRLTTELTPEVDLEDVSEAGLLAGDRLYNQVVFEPVTVRAGQAVTFFWEIDFPFGH